jgi:acyl dehydratase
MAAVKIEGIDGLRELIGEPIGPSDWVEVTQGDIDKFAEVSRDDQWIHVDRERAERESPFGTTIAHGNLTLSLIDGLRRDLIEQRGVAMGINYGWNKVRFPAPVPAGSRVRATAEVVSVDELGDLQAALNRDVRARPVQQEQVDVVRAQLAQRVLRRRLQARRLEVVEPDLGGQEDLAAVDAAVLEALADFGLVPVRAGRVDVPVADLQRVADAVDRVLPGDLPGAVSEPRDLGPLDGEDGVFAHEVVHTTKLPDPRPLTPRAGVATLAASQGD